MKLVTFRASVEASARLGVVKSDQVIDVGLLGAAFGEEFPTSMLDLIDLGPAGLAAVEDALVEADGRWPIGTTSYINQNERDSSDSAHCQLRM